MRPNDLHLELSQQILDICRREGYSTGQRLTERGLAAQLGVSRSPVRGALQYLESKKVVAANPGHGYILKQTGRQLERQVKTLPRATIEYLYMEILKDRFAGVLAEQVSEADLMRRYDVSRGQLQKVLLRLSHEGFVHRGQGHGWIFHEVLNTVEAYKASYEIRLAVEPAAIRSPNFQSDSQRLERLLQLHTEMLNGKRAKGITAVQLFEQDAELHETIAGFSGNPFFVETVRYHNQLRRIVEYESFAVDERMQESCEEHVKILEALVRDDREWAATLMTRHLALASDSIVVFSDEVES